MPIESTPTEQGATNYHPPVGLTISQREIVTRLLSEKSTARLVLTLEQRSMIRQIALAGMSGSGPEQFLVAFKAALVDSANAQGLRPSVERNELLARLVSVFIEELYRQTLHDDVSP